MQEHDNSTVEQGRKWNMRLVSAVNYLLVNAPHQARRVLYEFGEPVSDNDQEVGLRLYDLLTSNDEDRRYEALNRFYGLHPDRQLIMNSCEKDKLENDSIEASMDIARTGHSKMDEKSNDLSNIARYPYRGSPYNMWNLTDFATPQTFDEMYTNAYVSGRTYFSGKNEKSEGAKVVLPDNRFKVLMLLAVLTAFIIYLKK